MSLSRYASEAPTSKGNIEVTTTTAVVELLSAFRAVNLPVFWSTWWRFSGGLVGWFSRLCENES